MALMYVVNPRTYLSKDGEVVVKYHPVSKRWDAASKKEILERMVRNKSLTYSEAESALDYLLETIPLVLREGRSVTLGDLGSFHVTFKTTGCDTPQDVGIRNIKKVNIRFVPGKALKDMVKQISIEKYPETPAETQLLSKSKTFYKGKAFERKEIARRSKEMGLTIETIVKLTGLSEEEIESL